MIMNDKMAVSLSGVHKQKAKQNHWNIRYRSIVNLSKPIAFIYCAYFPVLLDKSIIAFVILSVIGVCLCVGNESNDVCELCIFVKL